MDSISETQSFNYSTDDIRFGDDNQKAEKAKQSFLTLKHKIFLTHDLIQRLNNKDKECEHLKGEVEIAKKEADKWKTEHFASLAKILKLNSVKSEFEKNKKLLSKENSKLKEQIAGDQKHLAQWMSKVEEIEASHSKTMMIIELEKSGLQSKIADLEQEIKILHTTYDIKKDDAKEKNIEKSKRRKKIKSPMKTTRSCGILPELDNEINLDVEEAIVTASSPVDPMSKKTINTTETKTQTISSDFNLPILSVDHTQNDKLNKSPKCSLPDSVPIQKPTTCDKNIMTDEFYNTTKKVYPLLCDKCELQMDSASVENIFKIMTACPPLITAVPPSPVRSKPTNHNADTIDVPNITNTPVKNNSNVSLTNTSVDNDSNVSLALEKIQQTLETLEKQIKKNKRAIMHNKISNCNHPIPKNCCTQNNDSINMTNFSQVNMMTALWSSMMKLTDEKLQNHHVKRKKITNLKRKLRTVSKQKAKIKDSKSNSWIVDSDTSSFVTDHDMTIETTPVESTVLVLRKNITERESIKNIEITSQNSDTCFTKYQDISPNLTDKFNCDDNSKNMNLFEKPSITTPNSHSINSNFPVPNSITRRVTQSLPIVPIHAPIIEDLTSRKQTRPTNVTNSVPKSRTGLLQKLRRLGQNKNPITAYVNPTKQLNYVKPSDESTISIEEHVPANKKRIARANKASAKDSDPVSSENNELLVKKNIIERSKEILNCKKRKVTRSITKSVESSNSKSSNSMEIDSIHSPKSQECTKLKPKKVLSNTINDLFGCDPCDTSNTSTDTNKEVDNSIINNHIESHSTIEDHTSEFDQTSNDALVVSTIQLSTENDNLVLSNSTEKNCDKTDEIIGEKQEKNNEISSQIMEKNKIECLTENIQVNIPNESKKIISKSIDKDIIVQDCDTSGELIKSMNLPGKNENKIIDTIHTISQTRNAKSLPIEPSQISPGANKQTLRKRRRINSDTKSGSESPSKLVSEKKKKISLTSNNSIEELDTITGAHPRKSSFPEIIQNEMGRFFNTKRIMTRSMKKTEESSIPNSPRFSPSVKDNSPQHGSKKTLEKSRTPVKENNTLIQFRKNFVKNLFPSHINEKQKTKSNNVSDLTENSSNSDIHCEDSMENISHTQKYNTLKKSEDLIANISSTKINDVVQDEKLLMLPIVNEVKIVNDIKDKNSNDKMHKEENKKEKNFSKSIVNIQNNYDSSQENMEINLANDIKEPTNSVNVDEKIAELSSTCEFDSPLSPDASDDFFPECPMPSNSNASLESTTTIDNNISTNELPIVNYSGSVRELRNRSVPMIPLKVTATPKNNSINESTNNTIVEKTENIKELLTRHLAMAKKKNEVVKDKKFRILAAQKMTEEIIASVQREIRRFTDLSDWDDSIYQSVLDNLTKINSNKTIAKAVVDLICKLSLLNEPLDKTHTPPAPMMTQSQQKIITLLVNLDKVKPDLINIIFNAINHNLFSFGMSSKLQIEEIQSLARIFVALCKIKKDRERVRMMICDALYSLQNKCIVIIHIALTSWTEVLPIYNENSRQYLPMCIAHIIRHHKSKKDDVEIKCYQLRSLIKNYYNYPEDIPLSANLLDKFLNELTAPNHDKSIITAIVLLAKKEGTEWTYKNIIKERLLKIIIENKNSSSYDALVLLGYLMKCFPLNDPDGAVKSIVEQCCAIHNAGTTPVDIQEGVVMALMLLGTRYYKYSTICNSILTWKPPRPLSPAIQRQLEIFFNSRTPQTWRQII
ncbi:hypothetical protein PV328_010122 [Microctonus aethiopoides]|uniref:Uncharacterized protein n=1 Tax=Microctonus aethiopoides TaxID=144406 RepID=A0AA39F018_9HYME|nr:hypothetical protein PV328_010122 [Microctonus aethiopoides]